jgi:hypothetical protein
MKRFWMVHRWGFVIAAAMVGACAGTARGATDANLAAARSGSPNGAKLFAQNCSKCHGDRGESSGNAPDVLGDGALPEYPRAKSLIADPAAGDPESLRLKAQSRPLGAPSRDPFRTAQNLYDYVSKNMPLPDKLAGSLPPEDYWAIVNFMLLAHGVALPAGGVTPQNASTVKL